MKFMWRLPSARETEQLGVALARSCPLDEHEPRLVFLSGELGAGKTTLAAALLQALGVEEAVRSPSYALIETYALPGGEAVHEAVHIDLYRLHRAQDIEQLGLRDYLTGRTLLLVEWPERAGGILPAPDLQVCLERCREQGGSGRKGWIEARSSAGETWLALTRAALPDQI
jgi:tRNA threonylcarbamoyl adenosine modification protein YjeE